MDARCNAAKVDWQPLSSAELARVGWLILLREVWAGLLRNRKVESLGSMTIVQQDHSLAGEPTRVVDCQILQMPAHLIINPVLQDPAGPRRDGPRCLGSKGMQLTAGRNTGWHGPTPHTDECQLTPEQTAITGHPLQGIAVDAGPWSIEQGSTKVGVQAQARSEGHRHVGKGAHDEAADQGAGAGSRDQAGSGLILGTPITAWAVDVQGHAPWSTLQLTQHPVLA